MGLGSLAIVSDLGVKFDKPLVIKSEASAAIGIASRIGTVKLRHIEVNQLWLQDRVLGGDKVISEVKGGNNLADALTKSVEHKTLLEHIGGIGAYSDNSRHKFAPSLAYIPNEEMLQENEDKEDELGQWS